MSGFLGSLRLTCCALVRKEFAVQKTYDINTSVADPGVIRQPAARSSLPWRLAAVIAISAQIISSFCGVLLMIYWVAASVALTE